jgi:hypothetical protein
MRRKKKMGRLSKPKPLVAAEPIKLLAAMYAARKFAEYANSDLSDTAIGVVREVLSRDTERALEILWERLGELRKMR